MHALEAVEHCSASQGLTVCVLGVSARDNIEDAVGQVSEARIVGLISRPELNGELCTLGE